MAGTIGIKIANGDFYPIMEEKSTIKKRLVLTTVHDRQKSVQIDLFRSVSGSMLDAQYIGSLLVEDIMPRPRGEPSIEMILSSDEDGNITADACDLDSTAGERHVLNVSLKKTGPVREKDETPDFNINRQQSSSRYESDYDEERQKSPWLIVAVVAIFIAIAAALLWLFLFDEKGTTWSNIASLFHKDKPAYVQPVAPPAPPPEPPAPPPEPPAPPPEPPAPPPEPPPPPPAPVATEEVPVIQAPTTPPPARSQTTRLRNRPPAPVSSYKVPAVIPKDGAPYQIRWGDTLWDISEAFYRDPWLYPRIARFNNISNPDVIVSGRTIRIPPKN